MMRKKLRPWILAAGFFAMLVGAHYWKPTLAPFSPKATFTKTSAIADAQVPRFIDDNGCVGGMLASAEGPSGFLACTNTTDGQNTNTTAVDRLFSFRLLSINGKGESVGRCFFEGKLRTVFCTAKGVISPLSHLPETSVPLDVNIRGTIVGFYLDARGACHGFVADSTGFFRDFSELTGRTIECCQSMNDFGCVVGKCSERGASMAFLWSPEIGFEILHPEPSAKSVAKAINNRGEVVGTAAEQGEHFPFIWSRQNGFRFLNQSFVDERGEVWTPQDALDVNNRGEILLACSSILRCGHFIYRETPAAFRRLPPS